MKIMKKQAIIINDKDNVAIALGDLYKGMNVTIDNLALKINILDYIPFCHKVAIKNISKNEKIIKYGEVIGNAISDINIGEHVHIHNIESNRGKVSG